MIPATPRLVTPEETAAITRLIERAPVGKLNEVSIDVASLQVVGKCECGCDSLFFNGIEDASDKFRIADGLGYVGEEEIGMILWASKSRIVHLELYNYSELPPRLPSSDSVCPFGEARRNST